MEDENADSQRVVCFIENTFEQIKRRLQQQPPGEPSVTFRRITGLKPNHELGSQQVAWVAREHEVTYSWPGKTKEEACRFGEMPLILLPPLT